MRRLAPLLALLLALLVPCAGAAAGAAAPSEGYAPEERDEIPQHEVLYFYESFCEACEPEAEFADGFRALTGYELSECAFTGYNVVKAAGRQALEETAARLGLASPTLPLYVVDGVPYQGAGALERELPQTALAWRETTESQLVYLYAPACASCERAARALEALPASVTLARGAVTFTSAVTVERVDTSARPELARALYERYAVPDAQRVAPCVFYRGGYLSGAAAIERDIASVVRLGWAVGGLELPSASEDTAPLSLLGAVGAGLVAGLNTCALSMLLLFLSVVLEVKKRAWLLCGCFLGAKLACYLLIGFVFLEAVRLWNPVWLGQAAKWTLTAVGAALVALNLWDAWQARRSRYGSIRNQLPAGLRGKLRRAIEAVAGSRAMIPAVLALGFAVAAGEFLCAGQLYLMRLLGAVRRAPGAQAAELVAYCLAFIAPACAVCAAVLLGRSRRKTAAFFAEHLAAVKLLTAAAMAVMILAAWLL